MSKIRVGLRVRPLSEREIGGGFPVVVAVEDNSAFITDIRVPERPKADSRARYRQFKFDHAFWLEESGTEGACQSEVYREMGPPLEKSILQGYNACLLAYGQSGTGKTHTMLGSKEDPGIIPRLCHNICEKLNVGEVSEPGDKNPAFRMEVSFMEIYREKVRDLLNPQSQLKMREHPQFGPHVQNLSRIEVSGENGLLDLLWEGDCRRAIGTTGSNRRSSRSHAIWTIYLTRSKPDSSTLITNQVHLVDLAGSEKAGFATTKNLLAEGADINRSLVALGNVISSLAEKAQYIPYRDSALTWLLKDSLGGNATTAIIITSSPASSCHAQTLNSFRFAQRARLVENSPRINLTSTSPALRGSTGTAALYSIMSAFEIKKDISRLSKVIRSAQNFASIASYWAVRSTLSLMDMSIVRERWRIHNGGLLRGLAPRASWTRLINALEGWNEIEAEHVKLQRAASEDTSASTIATSTKSDAMSQADLTNSEEPSSGTSSKFSTPTRIIGTEVFIPCSSSIKCLTWQQEEPIPVPKQQSQSSEEEDEYGSCRMTPPTTPSSNRPRPNVHHLKYLLPVQYPVTHHLDHASRISERIHQRFSGEGPPRVQIEPMEVPSYLCEGDSPLIRERIPTLVNPKDISPIFRTCSEKHVGHSIVKNVPVRCKSVEQFIPSEEDSECSTLADEFTLPNQVQIVPFEVSENYWVPEEAVKGSEAVQSQTKLRARYRTVCGSTPKRQTLTLKLPPISPVFYAPQTKTSTSFERLDPAEVPELEMKGSSEVIQKGLSNCRMVTSNTSNSELDYPLMSPDETFYFTSESALSCPSPHTSSSSSSPLTRVPLLFPKKPTLVRVIPEESETIDFLNETIFDIINSDYDDSENQDSDYRERRVVTRVSIDTATTSQSNFTNDDTDLVDMISDPHRPPKKTANGATGCKFRNHFAKEYLQMEEVGKRLNDLKSLMQMSQRYNVAQPYLDQISQLDMEDHHQPDPQLDTQIEACSGWNVDIEMQKVNSEITSLNKILKTGIPPLTSWSKTGRRESSTSTTTATSTSTAASLSTHPSTGSPTSPRLFHLAEAARNSASKFGPTGSTGGHVQFPHFSSEPVQTSYSESRTPFSTQFPHPSNPHHQDQASNTFLNSIDESHRNLSIYMSTPHGYRSHPPHWSQQPNGISEQFSPVLSKLPTTDHTLHPPYVRREGAADSVGRRTATEIASNSSLSSNGSSSLHGIPDVYDMFREQVPYRAGNPLDQISNCSSYQNAFFHSPRSLSRDSSMNPYALYGGKRAGGTSGFMPPSPDFCSCQESMTSLNPHDHVVRTYPNFNNSYSGQNIHGHPTTTAHVDQSNPSSLSSRDNLSSRLDNNIELSYLHNNPSQYPSHHHLRDKNLF